MAEDKSWRWVLSYQTTAAIKAGRASLIPDIGEEPPKVSRGYNMKRGHVATVRCQDGVIRQVPWDIFDGDFKPDKIRRIKARFLDDEQS